MDCGQRCAGCGFRTAAEERGRGRPYHERTTRIAGSVNFKEKYAPHFPRVEIALPMPGRIVTAAELTAAGLVATPEERPARVSPVSRMRAGKARKWPDYERCVEGAPRNHADTGPDISRPTLPGAERRWPGASAWRSAGAE